MTRFGRFIRGGLCLPLVWLMAAQVATAEQTKPAPAKVDPKAEKVIKQLLQVLGKAQTLTCEVEAKVSLKAKGQDQTFDSLHAFALERPNKLAVVMKEGKATGTVVSDGKQLYRYAPVIKKYLDNAAPKEMSQVLAMSMPVLGMTFGGSTVLPAVLAGEPYDKVMDGVRVAEYVGEEGQGAKQLQQLKFVQDQADWEMWVTGGDKPLPVRIVADLTKMFAKNVREGSPMKGATMSATVTYKDWAVDKKLPPATFTFTPPPGVEKMEPRGPARQEEGEPRHSMTGKPAPDFTIPLLGGGSFTLSAQKGKHVVVLDFWATWCGPCRRATPTIIEVTNAYKKKGVVFCAVNLRESAEKIKSFLSQQKLSCTVGLDKDGQVAESFDVSGIPTTVIIGKDGVVKVVHVGLIPDLKERLSKDLDAALGGKAK